MDFLTLAIILLGVAGGTGSEFSKEINPGTSSVDCLDDKMVVTVDQSNYTVEKYTIPNDKKGTCKPLNTFKKIDIPLMDCGTVTDHNSTHLVYENKLIVETAAKVESVTITRNDAVAINLQCTYTRTGAATVLSWETGHAVYELEDHTTFNFSMAAYTKYDTTAGFTSPVTPPGKFAMRQEIYFKLKAELPANMKLSAAIVDITALTVNDPAKATTEYKIVEKGCAKDGTYKEIKDSSLNKTEKAFSIKAFSFIGRTTEPVFLHAVMRLCDQDSTNYKTCMKVCKTSARRMRRLAIDAADYESPASSEGLFRVHSGPFTLREAVQKSAPVPASGSTKMLPSQAFILAMTTVTLFCYQQLYI